MFDIKNQNTFLGGQNVHNLIIIGLLIYIILKLMKKSEESGLTGGGKGAGIGGNIPRSGTGPTNPNNRLVPTSSKPSLSGCLGGLVRCSQNTDPNSGSTYGDWQSSSTGTICCKDTK